MSGSDAEEASSERMPTSGRDEPEDDGMGSNTPGDAAQATLTDGQVAAITDTVNNGEIEQAKLAQTKSNDPHVLSFASMMISHHGEAKQKQSALGLPIESSPVVLRLADEGRKTLATLRDKSGQEFDRAYLQAQIEQHRKVLDTMDKKLLPSAKNAQLRAQLQDMRPTIEQHLQSARQAQQALNTSGQDAR